MKKTSHCGEKSSGSEETMLQETVSIGSNTRIWVNMISTKDVESKSNALGISGSKIQQSGANIKTLKHSNLASAERKNLETLLYKFHDRENEPWTQNSLEHKKPKQRRPSQDMNNEIFIASIGETE